MRVPLRWRDMDENGHLNQAVYHVVLEEGRAELLQGLARHAPHLLGVVMARVELDYRLEVRRAEGWVDVEIEIDRVGGKSVVLTHRILRADGETAASGQSVMVAWDVERRRSRAWTAEERALLIGETHSRTG